MATGYVIQASAGARVRDTAGRVVPTGHLVSRHRGYYYAGDRDGHPVFGDLAVAAVYPTPPAARAARAALAGRGEEVAFHPIPVRDVAAPPRENFAPDDAAHQPTGGTGGW